MVKANKKFVGKIGNDCDVIVFEEPVVRSNEKDPVVLALVIYNNLMFFGCDPSVAVPHLRDDHKMSFEQLKIGMCEIGVPSDLWEKYY